MNTNIDPVENAIESLSAARWTGEPDWRKLQEKIMSTKRFGWKGVVFAALLAGGCFAAGAASGIAWDRFTFQGVMRTSDGTTANVRGEAVRMPDNSFQMRLETENGEHIKGGTMNITMPDGRVATLVTAPVDEGNLVEYTLPDGRKIKAAKGTDIDALLKAGKLDIRPLK